MQRATPRWSGCGINCNMVQPGGNRCAKGAQAARVAGQSNTMLYSSPRAPWGQWWHRALSDWLETVKLSCHTSWCLQDSLHVDL